MVSISEQIEVKIRDICILMNQDNMAKITGYEEINGIKYNWSIKESK